MERTMEALALAVRKANDSGVQFKTMAEESGVARAQISTLANQGKAIMSQEKQEALWRWLDGLAARQEQQTPVSAQPGTYRETLEIIPTASYTEAIGLCRFAHEQRAFAIITGKPGVGKTTVCQKLPEILPNVISLEAWPMMRLGDMLNDIAQGAGIRLTGSLTNKARQIERALRGTDTTVLIDEAEMLRKWDNDKMEVLRKIWDHTGITMILFGTPKLLDVVNRMDTTQLSRRMYNVIMRGAKASEIKAELSRYNIEPAAAEALAAIAADTEHGGMGSYTMMMKLCLQYARGGRITTDLLNEARQYKPGLRGAA